MFKRIRNVALSVGVMLVALPCSGLTLAELEKSYESKCAEILNAKRDSLEALRKGYLGTLKRIETKYQRAGQLDEVLLVKKESKSIEDGEWPLTALPEKISLETSAPRKIYLRKHLEIEQQTAKDLVQTGDTMALALDGQIASLTKAGDLTNAKLAQTIRNNLDKNPNISTARNLIANVRSDGSSRPALRIRRGGDNIEVLVSHDLRGIVGMDSPITNIKEADTTTGDTSARYLGEFVGAEGYEADSFVLFEQSNSEDGIGGVTFNGIVPTVDYEVSDRKGLKLSVDATAEPYVTFPVTGPTTTSPGEIQVSLTYFVPKANQQIDSIQFGQKGNRILLTEAKKKGTWREAIGSGSTTEQTDEGTIRAYLFTYTPEQPQSAAGDHLVVNSIIIQQIRFSAFVVRRLSEHGVVEESFDDPSNQPIFIENGKILSD